MKFKTSPLTKADDDAIATLWAIAKKMTAAEWDAAFQQLRGQA